jgi:2-methylisocitrate lyase-like PEP mutase family enzyme
MMPVADGNAKMADTARLFLAMHHGQEPLILPNAWDVSSALAVERAGAAAIATTSSGVAASLGFPDGEVIVPARMLEAVERIVAAVELPVTADMESGYGLAAVDLVAGLLTAGAVGLNLEDTDRSTDSLALVPVDRQAQRIAAVRRAADAAGVPVVINARIDTFLHGVGSHHERVDEAIRRARAYAAAGADCVYPISLTEADAIGRMVGAVDVPVNILLRPGGPSIDELRQLGVQRISAGGALAQRAMSTTEAIARRLLAGDASSIQEPGEAG